MAMWLAIPTEARSPRDLFERDGKCSDPTFSQCANSGLPSNFCCPSGSTCLSLAANTTLLCCPKGSDCSAIQPIPCDISMQDASQHPDNILKTTALTGTLPTCGSQCCPFGFSCTGTTCTINTNQKIAPSTNPTSTSVSIVPTISSNPSASPNSASNGTAAVLCQRFPTEAVLVGFFPGLFLGILLTIITVCIINARRQKRRRSGSSFGNIGEPQLSGTDMRSDFLRKPPQTPSTTAGGSTRSRSHRVRSLFTKSNSSSPKPGMSMQESPRPNFPAPLAVQRSATQGQRPGRPVTPVLQREPSYENINIFADGDTASSLREQQTTPQGSSHSGGLAPPARIGGDGRMSNQTTFTDMMEHSGLAGLQKGQPYVYKGGNATRYSSSPRTKEV
ncbi:uncharacterized protein BP5553_07719 [Venustampulla echinocandica]|uniref:Mid2 domain-containing protein n=1 Tax=Venustampulla echinocandica TaxID=2656787 RepID=A0A370THB5_9HELO|nr:uncharacterized protein BP5553_07719 [Venustampulla echinocandica]RDL34591.1 hypothetical protein BP5553_07719 [Venustampulla echinocandica]